MEQSVKRPQQTCTKMFFLIPKNVTSERQISLVPTLVGSIEGTRSGEVAKYRVTWDATDGRNGDGKI